MPEPKTLSELIEALEDIRDEYPQMADAPIRALDLGGLQYAVVGFDVDENSVWLALEEGQ